MIEFCLSGMGGCLRAAGEDAGSFLQGQFSQDLRPLAIGGCAYGLVLNHKGRIQADAFVVRGGPDLYWICSYFVSAPDLRRQLEAFIVADDVELADETAQFEAIAVLGPDAAAAVEALAGPADVRFPGRRGEGASVDWLVRRGAPGAAASELEARFGGRRIGPGELERRRIAGGIPAVPADAGPGELPQEAGLGAAISYEKGCYVGQEIMARLRTRGRVRRRLRRVRGAGPPPPPGSALYLEGRNAAVMRTAWTDGASFLGWAMVMGEPAAGARLATDAAGAPGIELTDP